MSRMKRRHFLMGSLAASAAASSALGRKKAGNDQNDKVVVAMMGINDGRADVEAISNPKESPIINFIRKCRIYKLINILGLHVTQWHEGGEVWREGNHYPLGAEGDLKKTAKRAKARRRLIKPDISVSVIILPRKERHEAPFIFRMPKLLISVFSKDS